MVVEKPLGTFGLAVIVFFLALGIFAKFLIPFPVNHIDLLNMARPPSAKYLLGTDGLGHDNLSRFIFGARSSMEIGLGAAVLATFLSVLIGAPSAFIGGKRI